jgi:hypothetical protein
MALTKNVMNIAREFGKYVREEKYTWRRRKWWTGMFHSRENSSLSFLRMKAGWYEE